MKPRKRKAVVKPEPPEPVKLWGIYSEDPCFAETRWVRLWGDGGPLVAMQSEKAARRAARVRQSFEEDGTKYYVAPLN